MRLSASEPRLASKLSALQDDTTARHLVNVSPRFRRFVDAQLQAFAQTASEECSYLFAAVALTEPLRGLYALNGGAQTLTRALTEAIRKSGGSIRFEPTPLRIVMASYGR